MCTVNPQNSKQKPTAKNFARFHNHFPLLTMVNIGYQICPSQLNNMPLALVVECLIPVNSHALCMSFTPVGWNFDFMPAQACGPVSRALLKNLFWKLYCKHKTSNLMIVLPLNALNFGEKLNCDEALFVKTHPETVLFHLIFDVWSNKIFCDYEFLLANSCFSSIRMKVYHTPFLSMSLKSQAVWRKRWKHKHLKQRKS